jgi:SDR family mycofactocin-dependent oxidoreductase
MEDQVDRVAGKVALITGAARGQGRSHAVRLAEEGADIIALDFAGELASVDYPLPDAADLEETARLVEALGRKVVTAEADIREGAAMRAAVDDCVARLAPPDILVANAGIFTVGLFADLSEETWSEMIATNLTGVFNTVKAVLPHLPDGAAIVLTSSLLGLVGANETSHYAATKHGVMGLMRTLAIELGPRGIRVNSINPGTVPTPMVVNERVFKMYCPDLEAPTEADFKVSSEQNNLLPTPWVEPRDISNAVLFLVSDEARFITGESLLVDAGFYAK